MGKGDLEVGLRCWGELKVWSIMYHGGVVIDIAYRKPLKQLCRTVYVMRKRCEVAARCLGSGEMMSM